MCVCFFCTITQKVIDLGTSNWNTLLYISNKFDIGHCQTKVKVTMRLQNLSPFTAIQTVRSHNSTLVQARKLILSMHVHLILIYKVYEYC